MEAILLFIANVLAGGIVQHYMSRGLRLIDTRLASMFSSQVSVEEIREYVAEYVAENGLEEQVAELARDASRGY